MCTYDTQRSHLPTSFLLAGFPLHATAMAASQDGTLLAVAALAMTSSSSSSGGAASGSASGRRPVSRGGPVPAPAPASSSGVARPQAVITLHNLVSKQQTLQLPVAGRSQVSQMQLMPDGRHVLALTAEGRLLGYRCADGSPVANVACGLEVPCLASAVDPSGSFLVAGGARGRIKVWGLHQLHQLHQLAPHVDALAAEGGPAGSPAAASSGGGAAVITCLPSQELSAPAGSSVLGAAFMCARAGSGSGQLLTVGEAGEVCCWNFLGQPCNAYTASGAAVDTTTTGTLVVRQPAAVAAAAVNISAQQVQPAELCASRGLLFNLQADCRAAAPAAPGADHVQAPGVRFAPGVPKAPPPQHQQNAEKQAAAGLASPTPRPLPALLQRHLLPRPPSAPPAQLKPLEPPTTTVCRQQQSASLPTTPMRSGGSNGGGGSKALPFWERQQQPEASLLITSVAGERATQVVRQHKQLIITSPSKLPGGSAKRQQGGQRQQRSAAWVCGEVASDMIPPYRPSQQLALLPPSAAVQHVSGFEAAAGFHWQSAERQQGQLLFAAGNVLLLGDLSAEADSEQQQQQQQQQRHIARLPQRITALAASAGGRLVAAAVEPAAGGVLTADIHAVDLQTGAVLAVLSHHSYAVEVRRALLAV